MNLLRWAEIAAFSPEQEAAFMARVARWMRNTKNSVRILPMVPDAIVFNGVQGLMVNCPGMFHSQVGDILARESGTFALMWSAQ